MGLISSLLGNETRQAAMSEREAFAGVLIAVASADGHISRQEVDHFFSAICRMQLFQGQRVDDFNAMVQRLLNQLKDRGREHVLKQAAVALSPELRETAFVIAVDAAFADGRVEQDEATVLEAIRGALSISDHLAGKVVDVIRIKNRG